MIKYVKDASTAIAYLDGAISINNCDFLIDECKKQYDKLFSQGPTIGGVNTLIKNSMDFGLSEESDKIYDTGNNNFSTATAFVLDGLWSAMALYIEAFKELQHATALSSTGFRLQHYKRQHGYYRRHHDGAPWDPDPINRRVLGVVIYLNTIECGGGTEFPEQGCEIDAVAGRVAIFPSNWTHPHAGKVPISCDKWIISTFIVCDRIQHDSATIIQPQQIESYEYVEQQLKKENK